MFRHIFDTVRDFTNTLTNRNMEDQTSSRNTAVSLPRGNSIYSLYTPSLVFPQTHDFNFALDKQPYLESSKTTAEIS
jgi:hypothetical protein